jgi:hypothetical protein
MEKERNLQPLPCGQWDVSLSTARRHHWGACLFVLIILILIAPNRGLSEDPFQVQLNNPIMYEYKYIGLYHDTVRDALEIERASESRFRFRIVTVDPHVRVCELSGEARASK